MILLDVWQYNIADLLYDYPRIDSISDYGIHDDFNIASISTGDSLDNFIDSLRMDDRVALANYIYLARPDNPIYIGRTICCKFDETVPPSFIDSLNNVYDVSIEYERDNSPNQFLLSVNDHAALSAIEIANIYYQLDETEFCHPNFQGGFEFNDYNIYDHYWEEQWAMHRVFELSPTSLRHKAFEINSLTFL
ncbi:MAG TPA: hypothetical protein ENL22_04575 [candidate division Zixibacteria bacterium]|nr:hypothetical protein [candidate division Zixibacteria bacterium]